MSFAFPKVYMLQPLLQWADELSADESLSSDKVTNFKANAIAHGLFNDDLVQAKLSLLYGKLADTELSGNVSKITVSNDDLDWSDSENAVTHSLEEHEVANHLKHVNGSSAVINGSSAVINGSSAVINGSSAVKPERVTTKVNVRRGGRMRK